MDLACRWHMQQESGAKLFDRGRMVKNGLYEEGPCSPESSETRNREAVSRLPDRLARRGLASLRFRGKVRFYGERWKGASSMNLASPYVSDLPGEDFALAFPGQRSAVVEVCPQTSPR